MEFKITVKYLEKMIDKIFAVLGIYEDCETINCFDNYYIYLNRLCTELKGCTYLAEKEELLSVYNTLYGLYKTKNTNHDKVKSIVFHCISVVKKMKVEI